MTRSPYNSPRSSESEDISPKPYELIPFPRNRPFLKPPSGHHQYLRDRQHGTLTLKLEVQTALHISTGVIALGSDVGSPTPLIKTMVQDNEKKLMIQGSSLKGCIRSVYEAITNSTLAVISPRHRQKTPSERLPCRNKENLCPASRVFGALDWQGLVEFSDAQCETIEAVTGFMPSLYSPRSDRDAYYNRGFVAGRKFYYHTNSVIEPGENRGVPIQAAGRTYTFSTKIHFMNLSSAELGTLLIALGQDPEYPFALKVGGGKPIGMGTMTVAVEAIEQVSDLRDRYTNYTSEPNQLSGQPLQQFMQRMVEAAHKQLIEQPQLEQLAQILRYPTEREPPEGMY
ncbi:MAG: CRISPR-associated protein [Leptolyngbyaceae cyanobacterium RM2_2_4]|nr:CRISPR-associated protein [Leptolyngbyaceae cyanobacterium SM1_4_3]NJO51694.1 CRISPR-associated protein [Leptolyngbyaceae cyanobacterium RM2_2_4]